MKRKRMRRLSKTKSCPALARLSLPSNSSLTPIGRTPILCAYVTVIHVKCILFLTLFVYSLQKKDDVKDKTLTKGRFPRDYMTNAGVWVQDRQWKKLANKNAWEKDARLEAAD